jgi:HNH endonuclease
MSYPNAIIKYMFDQPWGVIEPPANLNPLPPDRAPTATFNPHPPRAVPTTAPDPDLDPGQDPVPLERLESQICELAGHLAAATCRFLVLLGDFDARQGWADWEMTSCAQWLSWKCQLSSGTAREHVRVARALRDLPVIRAEFAAAHLSYAKVRALTRIATPATEAGLAEIAAPMTANQLERFARAHRQVSHADDDKARLGRRLAWRFEDDGTLSGTFRLPPAEGAVFLQSLRAAAGYLDPRPRKDDQDPGHDHDGAPESGEDLAGVPAGTPDAIAPHASAGTPAARDPGTESTAEPAAAGAGPGEVISSNLADALVVIAESFLAAKITAANDPEIYQVVVHVGTGALPADTGPGTETGVPAETPATPGTPGHPADPARCHLQDGPAISVSTAQMIGCTAALTWLLHDRDGTILNAGRKHRYPTTPQRRAARDRDHGRCRFPGCEARKTDLHHIQHWANGGPTNLDNLLSLCPYHHKLVHDRGYLIAARPGGVFAFYQPDGTPLPDCPPLPHPDGTIGDWHDAEITPDTIIPLWYGERLDLDYAIYTCFANAENAERQARQQHDQREVQAAYAVG